MSVGYILSRAGHKMGLNPSDPNQRETLLGFLNEAARELYPQGDVDGVLREQAFKVNGDQTITLPYYVGSPRGVRALDSQIAWHINKLRPRYNQFNWPDMWRNIRIKSKQALQTSVTNESFGVVTVAAIEYPSVVVTLSGPTKTASLINEVVVMDSLQKTTVNQFLDYVAVKKDRRNNCDVTLSDVDGKVLTVIPNNCLEAIYQTLDVSSCPWLPQNTSPSSNYMELLYKQALTWLQDDADEYVAFGYDDVIVNKMMQLWCEEEEKIDKALAYDTKATRSAARIHADANVATEDMVSLVANPHDLILPRIGGSRRRRYGWYPNRNM